MLFLYEVFTFVGLHTINNTHTMKFKSTVALATLVILFVSLTGCPTTTNDDEPLFVEATTQSMHGYWTGEKISKLVFGKREVSYYTPHNEIRAMQFAANGAMQYERLITTATRRILSAGTSYDTQQQDGKRVNVLTLTPISHIDYTHGGQTQLPLPETYQRGLYDYTGTTFFYVEGTDTTWFRKTY